MFASGVRGFRGKVKGGQSVDKLCTSRAHSSRSLRRTALHGTALHRSVVCCRGRLILCPSLFRGSASRVKVEPSAVWPTQPGTKRLAGLVSVTFCGGAQTADETKSSAPPPQNAFFSSVLPLTPLTPLLSSPSLFPPSSSHSA